jgi:hypothetical protein
MMTHTRSISILDPCSEDLPAVKGRSPALASVEGTVIGLLDNRKYHAVTFLHALQTILEQEYGVKQVVYATKFTYSAPCAVETIEALVRECDAIIHGIAD